MSGSEEKEEEAMYHYMEFDPYLIREHNQRVEPTEKGRR